ncbi:MULTISPECIES: DUF3757 domain-containing protein [unclassified Pseudomonas]|jgi:hypothetical protein|uniref:DUF3757 domain-containing protein n=1 Tax=unclassified Pseudomonas TaxID=196821 RepID=UPI00096BB632|nr:MULTISPECIES: DUF3757 domain-containing protein [unclassified Pseudomonas]MDY0830813.1 DUF3757 domain-containing protein [Pseudomonas sp. SED1]NIL15419.1 DUF3757 domain-containing protein [Pseudomonas sp. AN3A02]OLY74013.1 hypothetical protein AU074_28490 [Pseudomonas sp. ATCC PTA-122608]
MRVGPLYLFCFVLSGFSTLAAAQGCPYPSAVRYVDGHFQGTDKESPWISQAMNGQDLLETFVGAIFIPRESDERKHGYLEKCVYKTVRGNTVALRYGPAKGGGTMSLAETTHWHPGTDVFGQPTFQCDDRQPDNCAFTFEAAKR